MPKLEPAQTDPLELVAVGDGDALGSSATLAECLAEEFLGLGRGPDEVMELFRSPQFALAHRAWLELGEVRVYAMVRDAARGRERSGRSRGGCDA